MWTSNLLRTCMAVGVCLGAMNSYALAEDAAPASSQGMSIAIVDVRLLLTDSKAAQSIQKQIKKMRDSFLKELADEEKELRDLEKALVESKDTVSAEEFAKKRKEFEEKLLKTRREAEEKRRKLEQAAAEASDKLREEITGVVEGISEKKKYDLVLSSQDVVVGANSLNITKEVMKKLNDEVSEISVKMK